MPIESARSTRALSDRGHYKANEWRNLAFYLVIPLFKSYMHEKYFNNLIKYVVYIRILCQDKISAEDLKDAELIFIDFIREYEILYGIDNMTSNLHAHFHLIAQVKRFGPLTKCSGFAFENMFRLTREMYHGTVNFEGQIGRNLIRNQTIQLESNQIYESACFEVQDFINKTKCNKIRLINVLLKSFKIKVFNLPQFIINLLELQVNTELYESQRAIINKKGKYKRINTNLLIILNKYSINFRVSYKIIC
jgi:hypothetical protein